MPFFLKKLLGLLVQPLSVLLLLLIVGSVLLLRKKRMRMGVALVSMGTVLLLVISLQYVPFAIGRALETRYAGYETTDMTVVPEFIVVLGGGSNDDASLPPTSRLSPTALTRVVEGVRIAQLHPRARLVLTGGAVFSRVPEADVAAGVAEMLGIEPNRIVRETASMDTPDQARLVGAMVGDKQIVLVTSALHMPRSMALFRRMGMNPVPAPTAHLFGSGVSDGPRLFMPSAENLRALEMVMHEVYGYVWAWGRGLV